MWIAIDREGTVLVSHSDLYHGYQHCYTVAYSMRVWFDIIWKE